MTPTQMFQETAADVMTLCLQTFICPLLIVVNSQWLLMWNDASLVKITLCLKWGAMHCCRYYWQNKTREGYSVSEKTCSHCKRHGSRCWIQRILYIIWCEKPTIVACYLSCGSSCILPWAVTGTNGNFPVRGAELLYYTHSLVHMCNGWLISIWMIMIHGLSTKWIHSTRAVK